MRQDPTAGTIMIMLRKLKIHGLGSGRGRADRARGLPPLRQSCRFSRSFVRRGGQGGEVRHDENSRVWVTTWSELIREGEGRLQFIQDKLRVELSGEEIELRIAVLRTSLQGGQAAKVVPFREAKAR
jgi:hypothetical protein